MRPVYLEFCGINSFSSKAQIDFKCLLEGGVFGIFGDTGSGKSTILDSIHFALYGEIDRAPKSFESCINHRKEAASVTFDFEITENGERKTYRVQRERKRAGKSKAYFYEYRSDGTLLALAEGTREVDAAVEQTVGLTFADFKTCIALPQGDFAALVKSTPSERVKLVARLFNLDKYGERLFKEVGAKYYKAEEEVNLVKARMGENEGGSAETIALLENEIDGEKTRLEELEKQLGNAEKTLKAIQELAEKKREFDELCRKLTDRQTRLSSMQEKRLLLERQPAARACEALEKEWRAAQKNAQDAAKNAEISTKDHAAAQKKLQERQEALQKRNFDEEILRLSLQLQQALSAAKDIEAERAAKKALDDCIRDYTALKDKCPEEDFVGKLASIETQLSALGEDETLLDYLKHTYKDVLLADAYGEFRADLHALAKKYPPVRAEVQTLLEKYTPKAGNGAQTLDITAINLSFKALQQQRKTLKAEQETLEKRRRAYEENESKKKLLVEQGKLLRQNYLDAQAKTALVKDLDAPETLSARLEDTKRQKERGQKELEQIQATVGELFARAQKYEGLQTAFEKQATEKSVAWKESLAQNGFADTEEVRALLQSVGDERTAKAETDAFFEGYNLLRSAYQAADQTVLAEYDSAALDRAKAQKTELAVARDDALKALTQKQAERARLLERKKKYEGLQKELAEKEKYRALCDELRQLLKGNRFLEFIASEYLQEICLSAGKTLLSLTGGRYFLKYEDKEFKVGDNLDGGNLRAVKTLSGGETFLVSLSLALSLSAAICLKSLRPIEFFFLDEGFGTLDEKLVDTVMDVLGKLSKSFTVGLISHVEELKHRIDNKILVTGANESHGSEVRVECF